MGRVAAIRTGHHVAASSRRPTWTTMTAGAAIHETGAQRRIVLNVSQRIIVNPRSETLIEGELALKQLAAAPHRARRIARDQIERRSWGKNITLAGADLLLQRFRDGAAGHVRSGLRLLG